MKLDQEWYWKTDEEVGMERSRRRYRKLKVWLVVFAVILLAAAFAGLMFYKLMYDFFEFLEI